MHETKDGVMTKIFSLIFLSLFLMSCNKTDGSANGNINCPASTQAEQTGTSNDCTITTDPGTGDTNGGTSGGTTGGTTGNTTGGTSGGTTGGSGLPNEAYIFDSNILFVGTTATEQDKFDKAVEIIKKVVATEEFRSQVLNHTYNGVKTFVDNGGYTNAQIYQKVLDAAEKLFPTKNNAIDMEVELYYENSNVVGYTNGSTKRIWVNTKYFGTNAVTGVASNLFHEWLHKVGFGHAVSYSVSRDYSVPYAVGRIIGSIGKQFL